MLTFSVMAQSVPTDYKTYYRKSVAYGLMLHTAGSVTSLRHLGLGGSFKFQNHVAYNHKRFYNFEFFNLKHPKQEKVQNSFFPEGKSYYYAKINSVLTTHFGMGAQKAFAMKELKKGVQIAWVYNAGLALAFVKPNYVKIRSNDGFDNLQEVRYDPSIHTVGMINGRGSVFSGLGEMDVVPGIFGKIALNFEYSPYDERLKGMEVGLMADVYYKSLPMMYETKNYPYWITFYLMLEVGKKIE